MYHTFLSPRVDAKGRTEEPLGPEKETRMTCGVSSADTSLRRTLPVTFSTDIIIRKSLNTAIQRELTQRDHDTAANALKNVPKR